jgi:N-acetylneuraminic acid mutarotase
LPFWLSYGAATLLPDGRVFYAGNSSGTGQAHAYDPATETWAALAPIPQPVWDTAAVTGTDGRVYVVGGGVASLAPQLEAVFVYDPKRDEWYQ